MFDDLKMKLPTMYFQAIRVRFVLDMANVN